MPAASKIMDLAKGNMISREPRAGPRNHSNGRAIPGVASVRLCREGVSRSAERPGVQHTGLPGPFDKPAPALMPAELTADGLARRQRAVTGLFASAQRHACTCAARPA